MSQVVDSYHSVEQFRNYRGKSRIEILDFVFEEDGFEILDENHKVWDFHFEVRLL